MSVIALDLKIFKQIGYKMLDFKTHVTLDINYNQVAKKLSEDAIWALVRRWYRLNHETYCIKYKERYLYGELPKLQGFKIPEINTYQFVKWLQSIEYNIELDTIATNRKVLEEDRVGLQFLKDILAASINQIIDSLPEHKAATWSEYKV